MLEKTIFELSSPGRVGHSLPAFDVPQKPVDSLLPAEYLRQQEPGLPEVSEIDVMRHFVRLSVLNHHVDKGFYPLGSCTMKYNPKVNENLSRLPGFIGLHPHQSEADVQGALRLMKELGDALCEISGLDAITLQPVAGAHGELTALMMIHAYHTSRGNPRKKVLIPDSAHGTNPASTTIAGYQTVQIKSDAQGLVDLNDLAAHLDSEVAGIMLTIPNTLGIFEKNILQITKMVHDVGGLVFMDGANLNALMGLAKPGHMGVDAMHFNLHKTFSTPHGGGGPGGGGVAVAKALEPFLPIPTIAVRKNSTGLKGSIDSKEFEYYLDYQRPQSIGKVHSFFGNFGVMVKAYAYIKILGGQGLAEATRHAIINANYIMRSLQDDYDLPYKGHCKHECVLSGLRFREKGVKTLDIAKRLLDYGFHAPTIYFPLIVPEAIMVEPTETESRQTLDEFISAMKKIVREIEETPELVRSAPHNTPIGRLDDVRAAKEPRLKYTGGCL